MERDSSLPLLPEGSVVFEALPIGAVILDALAPVVGDGLITLREGESSGVIVIRGGAFADSIWCAEGARHRGDDALALIRESTTAMVSACRMDDEVMSLLGPIIRSEPCYSDLRLEWVAWPQLLTDLRARGGTFVVELQTAADHGVTVVQHGQQIATYAESHPALGEPDLLDVLAAENVGIVRVLEDHGSGRRWEHAAREAVVVTSTDDPPPDLVDHALGRLSTQSDDPNATLSALFGPPRALPGRHPLLTMQSRNQHPPTQVERVLPELLLLVRARLQRSSASVEEIVNDAAQEHMTVDWLAERVRATTVRGFMRSTFEHLADEMLALRPREAD